MTRRGLFGAIAALLGFAALPKAALPAGKPSGYYTRTSRAREVAQQQAMYQQHIAHQQQIQQELMMRFGRRGEWMADVAFRERLGHKYTLEQQYRINQLDLDFFRVASCSEVTRGQLDVATEQYYAVRSRILPGAKCESS